MTGELLYALDNCGYDVFRRWCQLRVWPGVAHGEELQVQLHDDRADKLLEAAEGAGWLKRGPHKRTPQQYFFAHPGGHVASPKPGEHLWEPNRGSDTYGEFIAFCQLAPPIFWQIIQSTRVAVEARARAEGRAAFADYRAEAAHNERDAALKSKRTARRRALAVVKRARGTERGARYLVTQFLDADREHAVAETKRLWDWDEERRP